MADILTVDGLKAYYLMHYFGVKREVRAVDDITMQIGRNEVYGIAGESSSGKSRMYFSIGGGDSKSCPVRQESKSISSPFCSASARHAPGAAGNGFPVLLSIRRKGNTATIVSE